MPVVINFDENSINILNDIAVLHDADVVSALKGQTISMEIRNELPTGNMITFYNDKFSIKPVASDKKISIHRQYLNKKIKESSHDVNIDVIKSRIKNLSNKTLKIYLPEKLPLDIGFKSFVLVLLDPVKSAEPPIKFSIYGVKTSNAI